MKPFAHAAAVSLVAAVAAASSASGQMPTALYDHVHMSVPDPQEAAQWYLDHIGGEFVDGRDDRLLFGTTRIMWLGGGGRPSSEGSVIDHLGFSVADLDATLAEVEAAGATIQSARRDVEGLFPLAFIVDPWGTRLELVEDPQHLGFHHVHLRGPDPEAVMQWYLAHFGGVRTPLRGRLDGILYPGNVWLLVTRGEARPSTEGSIDHIGWRAPVADETMADLEALGTEITSQPRDMTLPNGDIRFFYVAGPNGARVELVQRAPDMRE